uniref:Uncharacterized protein n=1 Tax=Tetranychus urticae TaxID=32264 RepID=T1JR08_TETUR
MLSVYGDSIRLINQVLRGFGHFL